MASRFLLEQEECFGKMEKKYFRTGCLEGDFGDQNLVLDILNLRAISHK